MYTITRIFGKYGVEESVYIYWETMELPALWSSSNQYADWSAEVCIPEGTIIIAMHDR